MFQRIPEADVISTQKTTQFGSFRNSLSGPQIVPQHQQTVREAHLSNAVTALH